jgi:hypothetical protein
MNSLIMYLKDIHWLNLKLLKIIGTGKKIVSKRLRSGMKNKVIFYFNFFNKLNKS